MLIHLDKPNQHFNAYYQDNSLLIQFAIVEFLETYQVIQELESLQEQEINSEESKTKFLEGLTRNLIRLLGKFSDHDYNTQPAWSKGHLNQLKNYCSQFSKNMKHQNEDGVLLYKYVQQVWIHAVHHVELLNLLEHAGNQGDLNDAIPELDKNLKSLVGKLKPLTKQILKVVGIFWDNENVLFFLYRKRELLTKIYGSDFFQKIFQEALKKQDIFQLLIKRFVKRGFGHLLNSIE